MTERKFTTDMGKLAGISELNNRFTLFYGKEEPSPTYPFLCWAHEDTDAIYMRNARNDAWIKIANLSGVAEQLKPHTHTKEQITNFPTSLPADGGNADTVDGVHAKIIVPSTANLLSATTERYTPSSYTDGPVILKRFKLGYPGVCILSFQYRGMSAENYPPKFIAELWINNKTHSLIGSIQSNVSEYNTYETEVTIPFPSMEIVIWGQSGESYGTTRQGRVRNAYIKGSLIQIDPSFQVVVD